MCFTESPKVPFSAKFTIVRSPEPLGSLGELIGWIDRPLLYVVRHPHSLNIFFSETTQPIKVKFHMELLWDGGTKMCSNGPGHMTKTAAVPIYGKNLKNLILRNQKANDFETWYASSSAQVLPSLFKWRTWFDHDIFTTRSNLVAYAFVLENSKTMDFSETIVIYDLKLATDDRNDKKFLFTSKLCPLYLSASCPRLYTCIKS